MTIPICLSTDEMSLKTVPFHTFDLPILIKKLKHNQGWTQGGLNAMILLRRSDKQIVLTAMHTGTEISSFQSNDSITLQIIEGKMAFHIHGKHVILDQGQMLTLHEKIEYTLTSREETVFLLTIADNNALS